MKKINIFFIILYTCLLFIGIKHELANARNEYLNNGSNTCRSGEIDLSVEQRDTDYNYSDSNTHENQNLRLTFRKYLGVSQKECEERNKIQTQNELLKQQIELYKVCKQINTNQNLEQRIEEGLFRQDLYHRINVFPITVPCLTSMSKNDATPSTTVFVTSFVRPKTKD